jgi:hypothetical protein
VRLAVWSTLSWLGSYPELRSSPLFCLCPSHPPTQEFQLCAYKYPSESSSCPFPFSFFPMFLSRELSLSNHFTSLHPRSGIYICSSNSLRIQQLQKYLSLSKSSTSPLLLTSCPNLHPPLLLRLLRAEEPLQSRQLRLIPVCTVSLQPLHSSSINSLQTMGNEASLAQN